MTDDFMADYIDVAERITEFRDKYPEGSLRPANLDRPYDVVTVGDATFLVVVAAAYRNPDDKLPGIGMAQERIPGLTRYTKGSELQNAETSAWGRAMVGALAADTKRGVASADETRARNAEQGFGTDPLHELKNKIMEAARGKQWDVERLAFEFGEWSRGSDIRSADLDTLTEYLKVLKPPKKAQRAPITEPPPLEGP